MDEKALVAALETALKGHTEQLGEIVSDQVNAKVKELGLDKIDAKHGAFPGFEPKPNTAKKEVVMSFFKGLFDHQIRNIARAEIKALNVENGELGGFLVPVDVHNEIARIAAEYGHIRAHARTFNMKRTQLEAPTEGSRVNAYWTGGGSGTVSNPTFRKPILEAKELMGLSTIARTLLEDADVSVMDYLLETFGEAFAQAEDEQGFLGDGSPFTGILVHSDVVDVNMASGDTSFADVSINNLIDLRTNVRSSVLSGAGYYMHREVWGAIQKITEGSQHILTFQNPQIILSAPSEIRPLAPVGAIDQYPVYLNDVLPDVTTDDAVSTPFIVFGNMKKGMFFGDRQQTEMSMSEHATVSSENMFQENKVAVRFLERAGIVVGLPGAFSRLTTAAS